MTAPSDRAFARIAVTALALLGILPLVTVVLISLAKGPVIWIGAWRLGCLFAPASSLDLVVHTAAGMTATLGGWPIFAGIRAVRRHQETAANLVEATMTARLAQLPDRVVDAARQAGVVGRIDLVPTPRPFAFVYGWLRPRVGISTGFIDQFSDHELTAVLLHESWHTRRRDPLRLLIARTTAEIFAAVGPLPHLVDSYILATEIAADRFVVAQMGDSRWLAGALLKSLSLSPPPPAVAFAGHADARIAALSGEIVPAVPWRGRIAKAALTLEVVFLAGVIMGGEWLILGRFPIHPAFQPC